MTKIKQINTRPNQLYTFQNYYSRQSEIVDLKRAGLNNIGIPVVICGKAGSGVTHLLSAIANDCLQKNKKAIYITSEWLLFLFNKASSGFAIGELKHDVLQNDLIAIDNIQYIYRRSAHLKKFLTELIELSVKWKKQMVLGCSVPDKDFTRSKNRLRQSHFKRITLKEPGSEDIFHILKNLCSPEDKIPDNIIYAISGFNGHIQQHINCLISVRFQSRAKKIDLKELSMETVESVFGLISFFPRQQLRKGYMQTQLAFAPEKRFYKYLTGNAGSRTKPVSGKAPLEDHSQL